MGELSDKIVTGLEELGSMAMSLEMAAIQGSLPDQVKQDLSGLASQMAAKIDEVRTLARTVAQ
jgi:hypothetical protein